MKNPTTLAAALLLVSLPIFAQPARCERDRTVERCEVPNIEERIGLDAQDLFIHPTQFTLGYYQSIIQATPTVYIGTPPMIPCATRYLITATFYLNSKPGSGFHFVPTPGANISPADLHFTGTGVVAVVELVWVPQAPTHGIWLATVLRDD